MDLHRSRQYDEHGPRAITSQEMEAYFRLEGHEPRIWDRAALRATDDAYLASALATWGKKQPNMVPATPDAVRSVLGRASRKPGIGGGGGAQ